MERISIHLDSNVTLSALKAGAGDPLIMIPGWSQSSEEWKGSAASLSAVREVIALDMRGHGESDKPDYGYRVYRLAQDLHETINKLEFPTVDLMAHSMGCSVIWAYIDLYGQDRIGRLVLVDQAPCMFPRAEWSPEEMEQFGCFYKSADEVDELAASAMDCVDLDSTIDFVRGFFTTDFPEQSLPFIAQENLKFPRYLAAQLLRDTAFGDWRDVIKRIRCRTLVVGGDASIFASDSQRWIASQIPGAQVEIFAADEGGSHFMFVENPDRFDSIVLSFLRS
ncbi:MAG TPA: alpha/beta hydrolase [Gammaproteobacteria bacterium]|nr:alpha/beta hydrolase [Gammaproteobacteria bacterium]|tara:strand:- start:123 stop:962 length:840 start_codon:yes stop_codon:yes gene_type:complete